MNIAIISTVLFFLVWFVAAALSRLIGLWRSQAKTKPPVATEVIAVVVEPLAITPTKLPTLTAELLQTKKRDELRQLCSQADIKWWKGSKGTNMTIPEMHQKLLEIAYG